jgi:Fur family peroxide stress response transcriptional regulator
MTTRRYSEKREAIVELMRSTKTHPAAQWVYERMRHKYPDISLGTVYRNINLLKKEGALASVGVVNGEERFDGEPRPHQHAVCKGCGCIFDLGGFDGADTAGQFVPQALAPAMFQQIPGFVVDLSSTIFSGLCSDCNKGNNVADM